MEDTKRKQFTFYRSYFDALNTLSPNNRLAVYDAITAYALDGVEPVLKGPAATVFILIKPTLDTGRKKAAAGKHGGKSVKASGKQGESKHEANGKQTASEKEIEKENEIENEDECLMRARKEALSAVMTAYMDKINPTPSPASIDELRGFVEEMGAECCLRAFDIALDAKKANWFYIQGILRSKHSQGVRCLADWDKLDKQWEESKSVSRPKKGRDVPKGSGQLGEAELEAIRKVLADGGEDGV